METAKPVFRNPDKLQVLPFREWMRLNLPNGKQGMVVEDLDVVPLLFGGLVNRSYNEHGKFMLVEIKSPGFGMTYAQKRLFGMMDTLLRFADPHEKHYMGCFLVWWDHEDNKPIAINLQPCTEIDFALWIQGRTLWQSYDFGVDHQVGRFMRELHNSLMGL